MAAAGSEREQSPGGEPPLTESEQARAEESQRLSALTVFATVMREGDEELRRPVNSLWWSGFAAGIGISTSIIAQGVLHRAVPDLPYRHAITAIGYAFGFVLVILSRLQLFTENTLTVVLPTLNDPTRARLQGSAVLWLVVLIANLAGTLLTATLLLHTNIVSPETIAAMLDLSRKAAEPAGMDALARAVPAGFLIAAMVWMLPSSKGFELFVIIALSWLIAAGEFAHVIAGSVELFLLVLNGEIGVVEGLLGHLLPVLAGNIIGGTGLFAMLAYAQIREET